MLKIDFRYSEIDFKWIDSLKIDNILPVFDVVADADHAQTNNARKGCLDFEFSQSSLREIVVCLRNLEVALGFVASLRGNEAFGEEVAGSREAAFAKAKIRVGLIQFSALHRCIEAN